MTELSAHFALLEFDSHDGVPVPPELYPSVLKLVMTVLEPLRTAWNKPLIVMSGYRTKAWNAKVGGAVHSTHLFEDDDAGADVQPVYLNDVPRLHALALAMFDRGELPGLGGLGEYPRWVHLDTRLLPSGRLRRWRGRGIGSEPIG